MKFIPERPETGQLELIENDFNYENTDTYNISVPFQKISFSKDTTKDITAQFKISTLDFDPRFPIRIKMYYSLNSNSEGNILFNTTVKSVVDEDNVSNLLTVPKLITASSDNINKITELKLKEISINNCVDKFDDATFVRIEFTRSISSFRDTYAGDIEIYGFYLYQDKINRIPSIITPLDNDDIYQSAQYNIVSSLFESRYCDNFHEFTELEIYSNNNTLVWSSGQLAGTHNIITTDLVLTPGKYWARVRYKGKNSDWSDWSDKKYFNIIELVLTIVRPVNSKPKNNVYVVDPPLLKGSGYSTVDEQGVVHPSTQRVSRWKLFTKGNTISTEVLTSGNYSLSGGNVTLFSSDVSDTIIAINDIASEFTNKSAIFLNDSNDTIAFFKLLAAEYNIEITKTLAFDDSSFYVCGYKTENNIKNSVIFKFDSNMNLVFVKELTSSINNIANSIQIYTNESTIKIIIVGSINYSNSKSGYILELSETGDVNNFLEFNNAGDENTFVDCSINNDDLFIIGSYNNNAMLVDMNINYSISTSLYFDTISIKNVTSDDSSVYINAVASNKPLCLKLNSTTFAVTNYLYIDDVTYSFNHIAVKNNIFYAAGSKLYNDYTRKQGIILNTNWTTHNVIKVKTIEHLTFTGLVVTSSYYYLSGNLLDNVQNRKFAFMSKITKASLTTEIPYYIETRKELTFTSISTDNMGRIVYVGNYADGFNVGYVVNEFFSTTNKTFASSLDFSTIYSDYILYLDSGEYTADKKTQYQLAEETEENKYYWTIAYANATDWSYWSNITMFNFTNLTSWIYFFNNEPARYYIGDVMDGGLTVSRTDIDGNIYSFIILYDYDNNGSHGLTEIIKFSPTGDVLKIKYFPGDYYNRCYPAYDKYENCFYLVLKDTDYHGQEFFTTSTTPTMCDYVIKIDSELNIVKEIKINAYLFGVAVGDKNVLVSGKTWRDENHEYATHTYFSLTKELTLINNINWPNTYWYESDSEYMLWHEDHKAFYNYFYGSICMKINYNNTNGYLTNIEGSYSGHAYTYETGPRKGPWHWSAGSIFDSNFQKLYSFNWGYSGRYSFTPIWNAEINDYYIYWYEGTGWIAVENPSSDNNYIILYRQEAKKPETAIGVKILIDTAGITFTDSDLKSMYSSYITFNEECIIISSYNSGSGGMVLKIPHDMFDLLMCGPVVTTSFYSGVDSIILTENSDHTLVDCSTQNTNAITNSITTNSTITDGLTTGNPTTYKRVFNMCIPEEPVTIPPRISYNNGKKILTFLTDYAFTLDKTVTADYVIIGGGGGGCEAGGGAGQFISGNMVIPEGDYDIVIGLGSVGLHAQDDWVDGGVGAKNGGTTSAFGFDAIGGGGGGQDWGDGNAGASGGGSGNGNFLGGEGLAGFRGGNGYEDWSPYLAAGGGGCMGPGEDLLDGFSDAASFSSGGPGTTINIRGFSEYVCAGGMGGAWRDSGCTFPQELGFGCGGNGGQNSLGQSGRDGVVIISYDEEPPVGYVETGPGPDLSQGIYDESTGVGFLGEVLPSEFISTAAIIDQLFANIPDGAYKTKHYNAFIAAITNNTSTWLKFVDGDYIKFIPKSTLARRFAWSSLYLTGAMFGRYYSRYDAAPAASFNELFWSDYDFDILHDGQTTVWPAIKNPEAAQDKTISFGGKNYSIRLINGLNPDYDGVTPIGTPWYYDNNIGGVVAYDYAWSPRADDYDYGFNSEWNRLFYRIIDNAYIRDSYDQDNNVGSWGGSAEKALSKLASKLYTSAQLGLGDGPITTGDIAVGGTAFSSPTFMYMNARFSSVPEAAGQTFAGRYEVDDLDIISCWKPVLEFKYK